MSKKVRIGPSLWSIQFIPDLKDDDGTPVHGMTYFDNRLIEINSSLSQSEQQAALFHEYIHAALYESGMQWVLGDNNDLIEGLTRALEHNLWPLVKLR
jgi:Zn-dependent peptidase ImmA (M78 family)